MRSAAATVMLVLATACVQPPPETIEDPGAAAVEELDPPTPAATSLARRAQEVTVRVRSLGCEQLGVGSGFVLPDGMVVTNRHVLEQPLRVTVSTWDGRSFDASVAGVASDSDLAVLRLHGGAKALPVAELREDPVEAGEQVYAVGYPGGGPAEVSAGEVVAVVDGTLLGEPADVIRVDAQIRQGNSGGPLLDAEGLVVGIVFALETGAGTGLAVPAATLIDRLDQAELAAPAGC